MNDNIEDKPLFLFMIKYVGEDIDEMNNYEFLFGYEEQMDTFWGDNFDQKPACLCNDIEPLEDTFDTIKKIRMKIKLDLAQESCCHSMADCIDGIIAVAWENIDDYEEYPQDGRLIFQFGEEYETVEDKLARKGVLILD